MTARGMILSDKNWIRCRSWRGVICGRSVLRTVSLINGQAGIAGWKKLTS